MFKDMWNKDIGIPGANVKVSHATYALAGSYFLYKIYKYVGWK